MGRSYGELDILFENRVPAWRFKNSKVDRELPTFLFPISPLMHSSEFGLSDPAMKRASDEKLSHDEKLE